MSEQTGNGQYFLGFDLSTQGLKATVIDEQLSVIYESALSFDDDLPEFKTEGGVHRHDDGLTVTSPALMWVAAVDVIFERMKSEGCPLSEIVAISGSGQQHGSVWLKHGARTILQGLKTDQTLREQFEDAFSVSDSPMWMDASTGAQCAQREGALGGPQAVADVTGSRAYERFTGNQIAKIYQVDPDAYAATERIALVSSFTACLLSGDYVPIDTADGSGMNLMDIRSKAWSPAALDCTAPELAGKLGDPAPAHEVVGEAHGYYTERYGLRPGCRVVAFSGDNPNSLAGLRLQRAGDIAISLGTSDTVFGMLTEPKPSGEEGHIFANPVDPESYMAMIVYMNGSLTREFVRDQFADGTWDGYRAAMQSTPPGNNGHIGFYYQVPEITPPVLKTGIRRFDSNGERVDAFPADADIRAAMEGQALSMRLHCGEIGLHPENILATGGASVDHTVLQVLSDVFGLPIHVAPQAASAALGAAYRALHGWTCRERGKYVPFAVVLASAPPFAVPVRPDTQAHEIYTEMLPRYEELERKVLAE